MPTVPESKGTKKKQPAHFYNEKGELDLRGVTGMEAYNYFAKNGIRLPVIFKD